MATANRVDTLYEPPAFIERAGAWLISTAIAFLALGTAAILEPLVAGLAVAELAGWLLLASAFVHGVNAFRGESVTGAAGQVFVGLLYAVAGLYFIAHPRMALGPLTVSLASVLVAEAVVDFIAWLGTRREDGSGWLLANAVATALLGELIFLHWPSTIPWAIGSLLGMNLIVTGISRLMLGAAARRTALAACSAVSVEGAADRMS